MTDTADPVLHHFDASPFSEKIRVVFGFKKIAWQSVLIPRIMPKPDLMPLTGGYRRTPVMQIGADIYCDTQIILREIEARYATPTLFPDGHGPSFSDRSAIRCHKVSLKIAPNCAARHST